MGVPANKKLSDEEKIKLYDFFRDYIRNRKTYAQLSRETGLSVYQVSKNIGIARELISEELRNSSSKLSADLYHSYMEIYDEAKKQWEATSDIKFLAEMRKTLKDISFLLGINAPPKAAKQEDFDSEFGKNIFERLIDDGEYEKLENEFENIMKSDDILDGDRMLIKNSETDEDEDEE